MASISVKLWNMHVTAKGSFLFLNIFLKISLLIWERLRAWAGGEQEKERESQARLAVECRARDPETKSWCLAASLSHPRIRFLKTLKSSLHPVWGLNSHPQDWVTHSTSWANQVPQGTSVLNYSLSRIPVDLLLGFVKQICPSLSIMFQYLKMIFEILIDIKRCLSNI